MSFEYILNVHISSKQFVIGGHSQSTDYVTLKILPNVKYKIPLLMKNDLIYEMILYDLIRYNATLKLDL